jgi:hypothetical protein
MNNPWKLAAIGMVLVVVTAVVTGLVVAGRGGPDIDRRADSPSASARTDDVARAVGAPTSATPPAPVTAVTPPPAPPAHAAAPAKRAASVPPQSVITACNNQAQIATNGEPSKTKEVVKDGAIGGLGGAAVGAIGGAIAGGGSGAGKGAAIGGVLGAGGGALYGLNKAKEKDAAYREAYAHCMQTHGYTG